MAILALPVRLGEFVRPASCASAATPPQSAALGTVAVERIVDGLLISILFFVSYLLSSADVFSRRAAHRRLAVAGRLRRPDAFLVIAQAWTEPTIELVLRVSLLRRFAPARADHWATSCAR